LSNCASEDAAKVFVMSDQLCETLLKAHVEVRPSLAIR